MKMLPTPRLMRRAFLALPAALLLASCATPIAPISLDSAIAAPYRGDKAQARDVYRHPKETLEFFGLAPDQSVLEIAPGGGWYTDILGPYCGHAARFMKRNICRPKGSFLPAKQKVTPCSSANSPLRPIPSGLLWSARCNRGSSAACPRGCKLIVC